MCVRLILVLAFPVICTAADLVVPSAELVGYGIFEANVSNEPSDGDRPRQSNQANRSYHFTEFTNKIPGKLETGFGVQYVINSPPLGAPLNVTSIIKYPEQGLKQPGGRLYTESKKDHEVLLGHDIFYGYTFKAPWQIVPGEWVFEVWHDNIRLIRKTFTVTGPDTNDLDDQ